MEEEKHISPLPVVGNLHDPVRLKDVKLSGISAEAAQAGSTIKVWTRLSLTSDDPLFHRVAKGLANAIGHFGRQEKSAFNIERASSLLMIIRENETADLWVDGAAVAVNILAKRAVQAGSPIFNNDIADIIGLDFPAVQFGAKDKIIYLFREGWRFGLYFDFNPDKSLSRDDTVRALGDLFRRLKYRQVYDFVANAEVFSRLTKAGWFPFAEIMGSEFDDLALACEAGFSLTYSESQLIKRFNEDRLDRIQQRWCSKPFFKSREPIWKSAINAYKNNDPVAVLKIILTEIEGMLAEAHVAETGERPKLRQLLEFARLSAERKSGSSDTLLFPNAFMEYLEQYTFANFDPTAGMGVAGSRHAVGHGAAAADSYTQTRALQAILTLDQFAFYF